MARGDDRRDPLIALRIPPALDQRLRAEAADTGSSLSEIVRSAIELRLTRPAASAALIGNPTTRARRVILASQCEHRVHAGSFCRRCDRTI